MAGRGTYISIFHYYIPTDLIFLLQISEKSALPADPSRDANFKEDRIDKLRAQKDEKLDRYRRTLERASARQWNAFDQSLKY